MLSKGDFDQKWRVKYINSYHNHVFKKPLSSLESMKQAPRPFNLDSSIDEPTAAATEDNIKDKWSLGDFAKSKQTGDQSLSIELQKKIE